MAKAGYWTDETPRVIPLGNREIRLYDKAEKAQFCKMYTDDNGEKKVGGAVAFDYELFQFEEVKKVLKELMMED